MGKKNYKSAYSKYKPNVDFTAYVDNYADLQGAWEMIEAKIAGKDMSKIQSTNPNLTADQQADYWLKRMGSNTKQAFGQAHAAEDNALMLGKYMGGTDVAPWKGTTRYTDYTKGDTDKSKDDVDDKVDEKVDENAITNPRLHPWVDPKTKESFKARDWSRFMTRPGTGVWDSGVNLGENQGLLYQRYSPEFTATYGGTTPFEYLSTPYKKEKRKSWKAPPHIEGSGQKKKKSTPTNTN